MLTNRKAVLLLTFSLKVLLVFFLLTPGVAASPFDSLGVAWVREYSAYMTFENQTPKAMAVDRWGNILVTGTKFTTLKYDRQGGLLWKATYSGSGGIDPIGLAVDSMGNVFVTGNVGQGIVTVKYNAEGNEEWVARYSKPDEYSPVAAAIAADAIGNVFVTGATQVPCVGQMPLTIKYSSNGSQVWVQRKQGQYRIEDRATGICTDDTGNVYVCGVLAIPSIDYMVVKYSPAGNELWTETYDGRENGEDIANAIGVDRNGNVVVSGTSGSSRYATVKYNSAGTQLWVATYDSARAAGMRVDGGGNVIVTGYRGDGTFADVTTVKYDSDGNQEWVAHLNISPQYHGLVFLDACPDEGVAVATSRYNTFDYYDFATVKYGSAGSEEWVAYHAGSAHGFDYPLGVAVDNISGEIVVVGIETDTTTMIDYATLRYSPTGTLLWERKYDDGAHAGDNAIAMVLDRDNNVFVTGCSGISRPSGGGTYGISMFSTVKYTADGNQEWVSTYGESDTSVNIPVAIAADSMGNTCVTGNGSGDFVTLKYSPSGEEEWCARYDGPARGFDEPSAISVDPAGNVYVTGIAEGVSPSPGDAITTLKYSPSGVLQWARRYNGDGTYMNSGPRSMTVDRQGNVYVTGWCHPFGNNNVDYVTLKYTTNGNLQWGRRSNGSGNDYDDSWCVAVDDIGCVYVTGGSVGDTTNFDFLTIKYNGAGTELWRRSYNRASLSYDYPHGLVLDSQENVYVAGTSSTSTGNALVVVKYDSSGAIIWTSLFDGPLTRLWDVSSTTLDAGGNLYVLCRGSVNSIFTDFLIAKFSSGGAHLGTWCYGDSSKNDSPRSILADADGNVYVCGTGCDSTGSVFATIKFTRPLTFVGTSTGVPLSFNLLQNYPNPFNPGTSIEFSVPTKSDLTIKVFDLLGREVTNLISGSFESGNYATTWVPRGIGSGVFFVRMTVRTADGRCLEQTRKMLFLK